MEEIKHAELKEKYAQPPSQFININGLNVHYRDEGNPKDGTPLVLLHGACAHLHTFEEWANILKKNKRVLRMDLPAFGLTGAFPQPDYTIEKYVEFLKNFLKEKKIKKCIIAGNSLGGYIAWNFTLAHPEMVEKLILIDSAGYELKNKTLLYLIKFSKLPKFGNLLKLITTKRVIRRVLEEVYGEMASVKEDTVDLYYDLFLKTGNAEAVVNAANTLEFSQQKMAPNISEVAKIQQPTLILWGEDDSIIPVSDAEEFHKDIPNSKLVIFKGVGHVPMEEIPEQSAKEVLKFIY